MELPYSSYITLGRYDADRSGFDAQIEDNKVFIRANIEKAREIIEHKDRVHIEGVLKFFDFERTQLANAVLIDEVSKLQFAVMKTE